MPGVDPLLAAGCGVDRHRHIVDGEIEHTLVDQRTCLERAGGVGAIDAGGAQLVRVRRGDLVERHEALARIVLARIEPALGVGGGIEQFCAGRSARQRRRRFRWRSIGGRGRRRARERREIGDGVGAGLFIGDLHRHRGARHLGGGVGEELIERRRIPGQVRVRHRRRVGVARERAGFASGHPGERGAEAILADDGGVTGGALVLECGLAGDCIASRVRDACGQQQAKSEGNRSDARAHGGLRWSQSAGRQRTHVRDLPHAVH